MSSAIDITQTKLAELAGVSQNTVHRALRGLSGVREETRRKIYDLAETHGYRLNAAARNVRTGRTGQVGVLMLDSPSHRYLQPPLLEITWGINEGLEAAGLVTTLMRLSDVDRPDAENAKVFREHMLDGVIVVNLLPEFLQQKVEKLVSRHIWLDTNIWRPYGCIQRDEVAAGRLAARALIEAGHRSIVYLLRPEARDLHSDAPLLHYSGEARSRGLQAEAAAAGVQLIPFDVPDLESIDVATLDRHLLSGAGLFLRRASEARALAGLMLDRSLQAQCGKDFSAACADDGGDMNWWWRDLTRVAFDRLAAGRMAAQMMVSLLAGDKEATRSQRIACTLIAGKTTRISA